MTRTTRPIPLTAFASEVLRAAQKSARDLGRREVAREDAVVGTLATGRRGVGPRALLACGVTLEGSKRLARGLPTEPSVAARADADLLAGLGIDVDDLQRRLTESLGQGLSVPEPTVTPSEQLTAAIYFGMDEAETLGHSYFGTEHLLLGLVAHDTRAGTDLFNRLGTPPLRVRDALMQGLAFVSYLFDGVGDHSPWEDIDDARRKVARLAGRAWDDGMRLVQHASGELRAALERAYDADWPTLPADVGSIWEQHLLATAAGDDQTAAACRERVMASLASLPEAVSLAEQFGATAGQAIRVLLGAIDELPTQT